MTRSTLIGNSQQLTQVQLDISILERRWSKKIIEVKLLTGGLTNQCWKISTKHGRHYVWRPCSLATQYFAINRQHEYQVLSTLYQAKFSPNVEALFPEGLLVEWVDGITLSDTATNLEQVMECLAQLHGFFDQQEDFDQQESSSQRKPNLPIKSFDYQSCILNYWTALPEQQRSEIGIHQFDFFYHQADALQPQTEQLAPKCLCHFDLGSYNMIVKPNSDIVVIDWEYAALASPILDVATSILAGQFDLDESLVCYTACRHTSNQSINISQWKALILQWIPLLRFMAVLWHRLSFDLYGRTSDKNAIEFLEKQIREV